MTESVEKKKIGIYLPPKCSASMGMYDARKVHSCGEGERWQMPPWHRHMQASDPRASPVRGCEYDPERDRRYAYEWDAYIHVYELFANGGLHSSTVRC